MKIIKNFLNDVILFENIAFRDSRGEFLEQFNLQKFQLIVSKRYKICQLNRSLSKKNIIRGLHFQKKNKQGKYIFCNKGKINDIFVDLRKNSSTFGLYEKVELKGNDNYFLWIPPGFAHGFYTRSKLNEVFYLTTDFYNPSVEETIRWDDPVLKIKWGNKSKPIVSKKDMKGKFFSDIY